MELRQLRTFVTVVEEQSFTRAASRLQVVQSAVSATIATLERELGVSLLDRSGHPIEPTDAGHALLDGARRTLAAADAARDAVDEVRGGLRGRVRLGVMQACYGGSTSVAKVVSLFTRENPGVRVDIRHMGGSADMAGHVRDGTLDMAFVALRAPGPDGVRLQSFMSEPLMLVCHREHRLAVAAIVGLADLDGEVFADFPPTWGIRIAADAAFAASDASREVHFEINDTASVIDFVVHDVAVALLPASLVPAHPELWMVAIQDAPEFVIALATPSRRPQGAAAVALMRTIERVFAAAPAA